MMPGRASSDQSSSFSPNKPSSGFPLALAGAPGGRRGTFRLGWEKEKKSSDSPNTCRKWEHVMKPLEIGHYLVVDPGVCHGKLTFKGTRVPVETILNRLA